MRGNFPKRDNAAVWALRQAGAVIYGKTVTAELGGSHPGPTTNPFDPACTPGGSSSGSAAAIGARMVPAALGTQVGGSVIRPAGFCGNFALKPTQGGINRGERQATSMSTTGVHAGCIEDLWQVAIEIASRAGGDRGSPGMFGPPMAPEPVKPLRLIVLETSAWTSVDSTTRNAFETLLARLRSAGVAVLKRRSHPYIEALEQSLADAGRLSTSITGWENRWYQRNMLDENPTGLSARAIAAVERAEAMSLDDYRMALLDRAAAQQRHAALASLADAIIMLSCPGPAPLWPGDQPGQPLAPRPTGDSTFNLPSSLLWAPAVTMPLLGVDGMPVGVQLMGQQNEDARMVALAQWVSREIAPVIGLATPRWPRRGATSGSQERSHALDERLRLLDLRMMARLRDQLEARAGNRAGVRLAVGRRDDSVRFAPEHQRARLDRAQPALQLRVVHVRMPAVAAKRFPVARTRDELRVFHRIEVGREALRIVPAAGDHFTRVPVEDVENVGGFAIAHLDAQGVDKDQSVDSRRTLQRDLGREPAAERQSHECETRRREPVDELDVELHKIVDRTKIVGTRGAAETRMRRRDDLRIVRKSADERGARLDVLESVQHEQGLSRTASQHFELDAGDRHAIGVAGVRSIRHRSFLGAARVSTGEQRNVPCLIIDNTQRAVTGHASLIVTQPFLHEPRFVQSARWQIVENQLPSSIERRRPDDNPHAFGV
jgi:Asp-tRNA(Asn)/Glu-tRNA(Gln) amidotransferase A subunit family amidase